MSIRDHLPDNIRRAAKTIGLATWVGDPDTWIAATSVIEKRLTIEQRRALAYAMLRTLPGDDVDEVLSVFFGNPDMEVAA